MKMPERCWSCDYWEVVPMLNRIGGENDKGHCALFDKITEAEHGDKCTAWLEREIKIETE